MAWLSGWTKRVKLTIDQNDIDAALSWFPVRVHLGTSVGRNGDDVSFIFDELESNDNRKKIAVTKADGVTQLYVEIEKWDDANEEAELWVSRDGWDIASDVDTDFYLYYDKHHADNGTYVGDPNSTPAEGVWDSYFKFVSHMKDDPDSSHIRDSTGNNNDGTKGAADQPAETAGQIDKAQDYDASTYRIIVAHAASLNLGSSLTLEALFKWTSVTPSYESMLSKRLAQTSGCAYQMYIGITFDANGTFCFFSHAGGEINSEATPSKNEWHRGAITLNGTAIKFFIDGVLVKTTTTTVPQDTSGNLGIGRAGDYAAEYFRGIIDESRISSIPRSDAWIRASNETEIDDLLDFGQEEYITFPMPTSIRSY